MRTLTRLFLFTGKEQTDSRGSDVSITLFGTLGSVTLEQLELAAATRGSIFGADASCEITVETEYFGTLQAIQIGYATRISAGDRTPPWYLKQVIVRTEADGLNTCFPSPYARLDGNTQVELTPQLVWHEDRYGTMAERPPPPAPPIGRWMWPEMPLPVGGAVNAQRQGEPNGSSLQYALWEAIFHEEVVPLVDEALFNLEQKRTHGTFLSACVQAMAGELAGPIDAFAMEELRRTNTQLSLKLREATQRPAQAGRAKERPATASQSSSCIIA